ncbi:Glycosyltransferase involved in cell wall bisynthesis [Desulfocicer vacuolatum DSM 3385]|uniref:Glycosyltransferase involved in cell wall bisynthesis n=1 Tax=Desulfocicer vacuolatum DSM 3385 TaxID=1121400 RepID=A0A1W2BTL6_9BACT|nr:glycosyltransferase family 4 protein [Desulfocicer vacuolatum]SMC76076.1 Glycosyltransferase involved in cell wall bisynthesis [Desulfocicer vacuolatum DSM 3385]
MQSPLSIAIVSYRSNPHCGGQGVYIRNLGRALSDLGHRVEVIAGPPDPQLTPGPLLTKLDTLDLYNPDDLFRTPKPDELKDPINLMEWLGVSTMGYPEPLTFGMRTKRYLKGRMDRYDIIHDNQCLAYGILDLSRKMPVTATIHHPMTVDRRIAVQSTRSFYKKVQQLRWYSFIGMQKFVARRLPRIITVSRSSRDDIALEFNIPKDNFSTIPIGIDTELFHPVDTVKPVPHRIIVTNSADTPLKGLYYLIHAVKQVADIRPVELVVVGTPKKNGIIEKLIHTLDLKRHVRFTGRLDHGEFLLEYTKAGLAVVPSLYEGFGLPVGEAMACGLPVICTTGGALPEVAGDAAKLVPPGNADALALAILELLEDKQQREKLARAGYRRIMTEFTWEKTAVKTVETYRDVIRDYR